MFYTTERLERSLTDLATYIITEDVHPYRTLCHIDVVKTEARNHPFLKTLSQSVYMCVTHHWIAGTLSKYLLMTQCSILIDAKYPDYDLFKQRLADICDEESLSNMFPSRDSFARIAGYPPQTHFGHHLRLNE